ncbi:MAG: polysaccharide pyruvyl transferase CsaB [Desulfotomaculum sp.]|nr:polysaccharide pyruvyl transferase CsaB [Desulfotomaculum sp.]
MAKVVLSGYYGFDNMGDEAILFSIIQALRDRRPGIKITVLSNNPARTVALYQTEAVNRWRCREVAAALKECDLLISGGGSLLQDVTGLKSLAYYLGVVGLARTLGKPVFFYAQGIGPVTSRPGRVLMKAVVNRVQLISVRDEQSKNDLLSMGINKPPVTVTADPVLGLEVAEAERVWGREILTRLGVDLAKPVLAVSVRDWRGDTGALYVELAKCCDRYAGKGWQVLFLPLHFPGDLTACRQVAGLMNSKYLLPEQNYTVSEFTGILSCCQIIVGMRLHALIMAAVAGVPVVGISYDPKIDRFLRQLGLDAASSVTGGYEDIGSELERVTADLVGERGRLRQKMAGLKSRALYTAKMVSEELGIKN